ncbi:transposase [Deinococcus sp. QL22]|uniref:transposase n=1 Tax=Deinococcus sp. QL22 TaxID=2939437 RepID=UPI00353039C0
MPGRNHSRDFKLEVVSQINSGQHTTAYLSRLHSLAPSLIHRWRKEVEARGEAAFTDGATTDRSDELRIDIAMPSWRISSVWRGVAQSESVSGTPS